MTGLPRELLDAVLADFHDDAPRLACADWLEEHGRAEEAAFVRMQLGPNPAAATDDQVDAWVRRPLALPPGAGVAGSFRRGFLWWLWVGGECPVPAAELLARLVAFPLLEALEVRLSPVPDAAEVRGLPPLARLRSFVMYRTGEPGSEGLTALGSCPRLWYTSSTSEPLTQSEWNYDRIRPFQATWLAGVPAGRLLSVIPAQVWRLPGGRLWVAAVGGGHFLLGGTVLSRLRGLAGVSVAVPGFPDWLAAHPDLRHLTVFGPAFPATGSRPGPAALRHVGVSAIPGNPRARDWSALIDWLASLPDLASVELGCRDSAPDARRLACLVTLPGIRRLGLRTDRTRVLAPGNLVEFNGNANLDLSGPTRLRAVRLTQAATPSVVAALRDAGVWAVNGEVTGPPLGPPECVGGVTLRLPDWFVRVPAPAGRDGLEPLGLWVEWGDGDPLDRALPGGPGWALLERLDGAVDPEAALAGPGSWGPLRERTFAPGRRPSLTGRCGLGAHARFLWPGRGGTLRLSLGLPDGRAWPLAELARAVADSLASVGA